MIKEEIQTSKDSLSVFLENHAFRPDRQEIFKKISEKKVEELHSMAYVYYQNQRYREADALFRLLVTIDPQVFQYWKGLGACLQMKKNYEGALNCYECAQNLLKDLPDPYLYVHIADCHFAMKELDKGFQVLELAKKRAKKTNEKKIIRHVSFMHERWKKNKPVISNK